MAGRTWIKQGVEGDLRPEARRGFTKVARLYHSLGKDFFVTSVREGNHTPGSLHYQGLAFDFLQKGVPKYKIEQALGFEPGWWILVEDTHVHAQREGVPIPSMGV